jgi:hypothetical protein
MLEFLRQHADAVIGVLHGFDRLRFRGTLRRIASVKGLGSFLSYGGVLLKDAGGWMKARTEELKDASLAAAHAAGRPVQYVNDPSARKEDLARAIVRRDGIDEGLVCVLTATEPCWSFDVHRNRETRKLELVSGRRKCLHLYHYFRHPAFGLMHMRLQTWFPFNVWCCVNGREWLARQLDAAGVGYVKRDNCLVDVADLPRAQALADEQVTTDFAALLEPVADRVHPLRRTMFDGYPMDYYWSCQESEFASDVLFKRAADLSSLYPHLVRHGMQNLGSLQVMRFLGRKPPAVGGPYGTFAGEAVADVKERPEGIRIKHAVNGNSIKMYNKQGSVLRVETTVVRPDDFKVFRGTEEKPEDKRWRTLRKGVVDVRRRAEVSRAANGRYADAMAAAACPTPLADLAGPVCRRSRDKGRPVRALNPLAADDAALLAAVNRGEHAINGFRNRDLRRHLYDGRPTPDAAEQRRRGAATTRKLRLLRAHGLIKKVPKTHRYVPTDRGRQTITAVLAARAADVGKLMAA